MIKPPAGKEPEKTKFFPFCSERCKLIDLGGWLDGKYRIISKLPKTNSDEENNKLNKIP